ncbi:2-oxo-4-hydroxy-4-carboxy-5-ureidoimidazoline decarboxylase [Agromyces sp. MMS24-K17]|uniref:2-oxo-4-hydroxy-4-carboxy-5-ureidoimidazoline decarboxylase n=1 Tax=Agromyces sp. MMS24-K17 TaxID=3372850 RepID=UPI00375497B2
MAQHESDVRSERGAPGAGEAASRFRADLAACLHVRRWIDDVAAGAPFASFDDLAEAAAGAATPLDEAEIDEALASHPRIGEKPVGDGAEQRFSRAEQASSDADDRELASAIAAGNAAYEARFDRVFLIRAAGRSRVEILAELERRLRLDEASELEVVGEQLRQIMLLRLEATFGGAAAPIGAAA